MPVDYIRRDIPEEISEEGGARIQIVNKSTIGLSTSINDAIDGLFVVGAPSMIEGYFKGLMRSVFEGIREDGHPRCVGDITFFPVPGGTFDLDKGWDPLVNDVRIKVRLANDLTLDVSGWTFRDVTRGRQVFSIDTVSDGTTDGVVTTGKTVALNGRNFPDKSLLTVAWTCGLKSGTIAAAKVTSSVSRIDLAADAITDLTAEDDGKDIVFTVKGCYNKAQKTAAVHYAAPVGPTITLYKQNTKQDNCVEFDDHVGGKGVTVTGTNLAGFNRARGDTFIFKLIENGVVTDTSNNTDDVTGSTDTTVLCANGLYPNGEAFTTDAWYGKTGKLYIKINGITAEHPVSYVAP